MNFVKSNALRWQIQWCKTLVCQVSTTKGLRFYVELFLILSLRNRGQPQEIVYIGWMKKYADPLLQPLGGRFPGFDSSNELGPPENLVKDP